MSISLRQQCHIKKKETGISPSFFFAAKVSLFIPQHLHPVKDFFEIAHKQPDILHYPKPFS